MLLSRCMSACDLVNYANTCHAQIVLEDHMPGQSSLLSKVSDHLKHFFIVHNFSLLNFCVT